MRSARLEDVRVAMRKRTVENKGGGGRGDGREGEDIENSGGGYDPVGEDAENKGGGKRVGPF